jgi:hypothetical protein
VSVFKPAGAPAGKLEHVVMTLDELEALRLADLEGLYQAQAANRMGVSRSTFGRILEAAHRKVALALVEGRALRIEGGPVIEAAQRRCERCSAEWRGSPDCPRCRHAPAGVAGDDEAPRASCGRGQGRPPSNE